MKKLLEKSWAEEWEIDPDRCVATVQEVLNQGIENDYPPELWHSYLNKSRRTKFLKSLSSDELRHQWAEQTFHLIKISDYDFDVLFRQRMSDYPDRPYLQYFDGTDLVSVSYREVYERSNAISAGLRSLTVHSPRLAIISENSVHGALTDLACLAHGIFVSPVNPHFGSQVLEWIIKKLQINIVAVGSSDLLERVRPIVKRLSSPVQVLLLSDEMQARNPNETPILEMISLISHSSRPSSGPGIGLHQDATVLFTSGSTGLPKGVRFTQYNLLTKRFARAAALPEVGDQEVFLSFLPLYHTFGRFLELQGALFWGGTYVFTGNPSFETLQSRMKQVQPTALISIPWRWKQLYDYCLPRMEETESRESREKVFRNAVGKRLRWGLSAAGALEPAVFHFFNRYGVDLCSGFGMTEATGGITMTPPGAYEDNTVGLPLPGVRARISEEGELEITGPYIARYLEDENKSNQEYWLKTGDIFRVRPSGYYEIVDRLKDIYKNRKGQTIAPGAVEKKLTDVPGFKRSFLVGDGRAFNVLLVVPDLEDPVLKGDPKSENSLDYFRRIITALNQELAPYERIVNFEILDRDFEANRGELTPKNSYRRKIIEEHFSETIEQLYRSDCTQIHVGPFLIKIPRWFFRDLSILETDIQVRDNALWNRSSGRFLEIKPAGDFRVQIGDLEYVSEDSYIIDLGLFARQPLLWIGNPALADFSPCKDGWDQPLHSLSPQVFLPRRETGLERESFTDPMVQEPTLIHLHRLCSLALFGPEQDALAALSSLRERLKDSSLRIGTIIRRRIEALARHPRESLRCLAYEILLLDEPVPDYARVLPAFLLSGLSFLSDSSIENIANANIEARRLDSLRKRLRYYRTQLDWSKKFVTAEQFDSIFTLLENFVYRQPEYYIAVRSELVNWALHDADTEIAHSAQNHIERLSDWLESKLAQETDKTDSELWDERLIFEDRLSKDEISAIKTTLVNTTFLKQSTMLAFDENGVEIRQIPSNGIWISRVSSLQNQSLYRLSINTLSGRHYDLLLAICHQIPEESMMLTVYWTIALQGFVESRPVVRRFGCYRPDLNAMSMALVNDLTVWERIRELAETSRPGLSSTDNRWKRLFIRGISAFILGWYQSERRIIPGSVTPANVVVPSSDFRKDVKILSLSDWKSYSGARSLIKPILRNFYLQTVANYPTCQGFLEISWIFDACTEALGQERARNFLEELRSEMRSKSIECSLADFPGELDRYLDHLENDYYVPLSLEIAIERYRQWEKANPQATPTARENQVLELQGIYQLEQYGDLARYYLYRQTFFADSPPETLEVFDRLISKLNRQPERKPTQFAELSELMSCMTDHESRLVASLMVLPASQPRKPLEILTVGPEKGESQIVVSSYIYDRRGGAYSVREPIGAAEIGRLYRLSIHSGFPISVAEQETYLLVIDPDKQIVGGICYRLIEPTVAHLDGIAISNTLKGRGLGSALLEDFCQRMTSQGIQIINTLFLSREFFKSHGFRLDREWSGLVRFLGDENKPTDWN